MRSGFSKTPSGDTMTLSRVSPARLREPDSLVRLHSKNATDPLIMAYLGSARAILEAARA